MRAPDFWRADPRGLGPLWSFLLWPLSLIWRLGAAWRRWREQPERLGLPVICVGNLVVGGAGKTPTVLALAERLNARGLTVHIVSRGYGGTERGPLRVDPERHTAAEVGDEALLLARAAPTWIGRDRVATATAAQSAGAEMLLLDDGFQDPGIAKDLSLLVVDGDYAFGNGRILPAGPLRESVASGIKRADAILLIGPEAASPPHPIKQPLLRAQIRPLPVPELTANLPAVAFAGIGRPEKFFATLEEIGCRLVSARAFPDHHSYRAGEIASLLAEAQAAGARLVTTEKDWVRLDRQARTQIPFLPIALVFSDEAALDRVLAPLIAKIAGHART